MAVEVLGRPPPRLGSGRFAVVEELGDGGTATVFLAWDASDRRWCALKALMHKHLDDPEIRRRFAQEAEALARLDHPNVPKLYAHHATAIPPFVVMELCRNGTVMDWLRDHGPMPPGLATDVIYQVCEALGAAHAMGIVHRDVKPHNVLLDDHGVCKLTDFGIARIHDTTSLTATGTQIGTFSFMAPEQRSNTKTVDERADVYSVGATLFTMLTGRTSSELFVAEGDDELLADLPAPFREVVLKLTRYHAEDRYADMREVQTAVLSALARMPGGPPEVHPPLAKSLPPLPSGPPPVLPPFRRFPDLERCIALDSNQPTFVPVGVREELDALPALARRPSVQPPPPRRVPDAVVLTAPVLSPAAVSASSAPTASESSAPAPTRQPAPQRSRWVGYAAGAGGLALVGLLAVIGVGASQVRAARTEAVSDERALVGAVLAEPELGSLLGAERFAYERAYDTVVGSHEDAERREAALAAVEVGASAVEQGTAEASARQKVRVLDDRRDAYVRARDAWGTMARSFPGSWAVAVGVASAPDR